jgi:hypothetical protein
MLIFYFLRKNQYLITVGTVIVASFCNYIYDVNRIIRNVARLKSVSEIVFRPNCLTLYGTGLPAEKNNGFLFLLLLKLPEIPGLKESIVCAGLSWKLRPN